MHISTVVGFLASASIPAMVTAAAITTPVVGHQKFSNFSSTCSGFQLIGNSTLRASCHPYSNRHGKNGTDVLTELDLNRCLVYDPTLAGQTDDSVNMRFQPGGTYTDQCNHCSLSTRRGSPYIGCVFCERDGLSEPFGASMRLDVGITNQGGYLACDGEVGTRVFHGHDPSSVTHDVNGAHPSSITRDVDVDAAQDDWSFFSTNCTVFGLVGDLNSTLRANCRNRNTGGRLTTDLDLNLCIGVDDYQSMTFQVYGKLTNYCDKLWIGRDNDRKSPVTSPFLHGNCYPFGDHSNPITPGNLNLDSGIGVNNDGYLGCRGGLGTVFQPGN